MNRIALAAFSLVFAPMLALMGCGDDGGTTVDAATGSDTGTTVFCPPTAPDRAGQSGVCCSRAENAAESPEFRMSDVDIMAPSTLASPVIAGVLDDALFTEFFNWLLRAEISGTDVTITTGFGRRSCYPLGEETCDGDSSYSFDTTGMYPPLTFAGTLGGETVSADRLPGQMILPIVDKADPTMILLTLPLENLELSMVTMTEDRNCVGERRPSSYKTDDGAVSAFLTVEAAQAAELEVGPVMSTLCAFAAGIAGEATSNCATVPQAMWELKPDSLCEGSPSSCTMGGCDQDTECNAWFVQANFAAHAVNID